MIKYILPAITLLTFFTSPAQTARINFPAPMVYPEGIAYYPAAKVFFVSSVTTGNIGKVDLNGKYIIFYEDHSLKSSYGMKVDLKRGRLWVCTGDANYSIYSNSTTYKKLARLISLDLSTGQKIDDIDLSNLVAGNHFLNDLALDAIGNIYITDSYSPVIYKVNLEMKPSVFSQNEFFKSIDIGLNGIVWHPKGFLIVGHSTNGALYKVPTDNPDLVEKIRIDGFFPGADGLLVDQQGELALVQNRGANKVYNIRSVNNWQSAKIIAATLLVDRFDNPTTLSKKDGSLYALNAKLNELSDKTRVPSKEFSLQRVRFVSVQ